MTQEYRNEEMTVEQFRARFFPSPTHTSVLNTAQITGEKLEVTFIETLTSKTVISVEISSDSYPDDIEQFYIEEPTGLFSLEF